MAYTGDRHYSRRGWSFQRLRTQTVANPAERRGMMLESAMMVLAAAILIAYVSSSK